MDKSEKEAIKKYLKFQHKDLNIIDGYDIDKNIISDPSALKTIESIIKHKKEVKKKMLFLAKEIIKRAEHHDDSKLQEPELNWLIEMDKEPKVKYGSPEYYEKIERWKCFFEHHYKNNSHHPDHYKDTGGIYGMNIVDLAELMCDIISYIQQLNVSQAGKIIDEQKERFGIDDSIAILLLNTLTSYYAWIGNINPTVDKKYSDEEEPLIYYKG